MEGYAMPEWLLNWAKRYQLIPAYITALIRFWQTFLWGESVLAAGMIVYMAFFHPPAWVVATYFFFVMFVAGYLVWRADHARLLPQIAIKKFHLQRTPIHYMDQLTRMTADCIYVQLEPSCLTDAPVEECRGHLLRVLHRVDNGEWELTEMNEPCPMEWSHGDGSPVTLHPGVPRRLNVFRVDSKDKIIIPLVIPLPLRAMRVFSQDGQFRFEIKLTAKDCQAVNVAIECERGETWDHPKVELIKA
jgi:hypothetical protein